MTGLQNSLFFWLILLGLLVFLAVLPTLIAIVRDVDDIGYIVLVNVICCATVLGWPIALIAAITWPRRDPRPARSPSPRPPAPPLDRFRGRIHGQGPHA